MTLRIDVPAGRPATLTAWQLETVQRLWSLAGLPPLTGYGAVFLAIAVGADRAVARRVASVDFNDPDSVAGAVEALAQWCASCGDGPRTCHAKGHIVPLCMPG
jgi:hypothetical protein